MCPVVVVVTDVFSHQSFQMPFIDDNHIVEHVPTAAADPSFCNTILPWASEAGSLRLNAEAPHRVNHFFIEARAAIKDQVSGRGFKRKRLAQLLYNPGGSRMFCDVTVQNSPPTMRDDKEAIQHA